MARSLCSSTLKNICEENRRSLWKIRMILKEKSEGWLEFDNNNDVEKYIVKELSEKVNVVKKDPIKIKIDDYDTGSQQEVILGYYDSSDKYYIGEIRRMTELNVGDEVGIFYDPIAKNLCFSVLKQAKPIVQKKKQAKPR
ncbi:hypothetical protein EUTSA_v10026957mg [Eutrema salsugineum]|uniref:Uncharacterized protein n=1 Tax=Eutrema salsugineum TaxID=72664 RepID=V4MD31_EUTSA|nr:uncharacterized protein LOC18028692 [Eutrema salsugineum]ESQ54364.1 hypothetical protein EUTSA_v10026957mg [Eutrema salsugineum]